MCVGSMSNVLINVWINVLRKIVIMYHYIFIRRLPFKSFENLKKIFVIQAMNDSDSLTKVYSILII